MDTGGTDCIEFDWNGRATRIEYRWAGRAGLQSPVMVFLHEGLGSVALWKDFPDWLCDRLGLCGLVYSRPGYGRSSPRAPHEHWAPDFMHRQAFEVLPVLLDRLGVTRPWLFGHSDGGSIALLYAASFPDSPAGAIVVAPHLFVEDLSVASIALARTAYLGQGLRDRLARYHDDVDSAFFGWNDIWLSPAFRDWNIEDALATIRCPMLALQGEDDEYGTLRQVTAIRDRLPGTTVVALPACGHSPHRDQPEALCAATEAFVARHR